MIPIAEQRKYKRDVITQLTRIADSLEFNQQTTGKVEEITQVELDEIKSDMDEFDKFFDNLNKNFEIEKAFPARFNTVKNLVRHAYNYNK